MIRLRENIALRRTSPPIFFFLSFAYYLSGLCGSVPSYRDSGDLIASIHALGIAHPPGYALYVLVGKLFVTLLPFGNVAYRVNVMSAFFAAGTVVLLFQFLLKLLTSFPAVSGGEPMGPLPPAAGDDGKNWVLCFLVSILWGASPAVIALARVAEMYTLAVFLAAAILWLLLEGSDRSRSWAAFLLGLGLSAHATLLVLAPLFLIAKPPPRRQAVTLLLSFLLGLCVFLYLPIRAAQHPAVNWGDPSTWRNFWRVVTRADYGGLKLHPEESAFSWTPASILAQLRYFAWTMKNEWGWGAVIAGGIGLFVTLNRPSTRRMALALFCGWLLAGPAFFLLSNLPLQENTTSAILQPYLLLSSLLWAPFVVMGVAETLSLRRFRAPLLAGIAAILLASRPWVSSSQRHDFYAYDYARNLLRCLPQRAVLYDPDDPTHFTIQVLQELEGRRRDVVLLNFFRTRWGYEEIKRRWPELLPPIPIASGQDLVKTLWSYSVTQRPFFAELPQKLTPLPYHVEGLAYAALSESTETSRRRAESLLAMTVRRGDFVTRHHADFFTSHLVAYYAAAENNLGAEYAGAGAWDQAAAHYRAALQIEPDQAAAQKNLAVALQKMRKLI